MAATSQLTVTCSPGARCLAAAGGQLGHDLIALGRVEVQDQLRAEEHRIAHLEFDRVLAGRPGAEAEVLRAHRDDHGARRAQRGRARGRAPAAVSTTQLVAVETPTTVPRSRVDMPTKSSTNGVAGRV